MSADERAFITSICADPADDVRRLVFADWLEENAVASCRWCAGTGASNTWSDGSAIDSCPECGGAVRYAERAEFVRVQVAASGLQSQCEVLSCGWSLAGRKHAPGWAAVLEAEMNRSMTGAPRGTVAILRRGFVEAVSCTLAALFGKPCEACDVSEGVRRYPTTGGDWIEGTCNVCLGIDRTTGVAADLFAAQPVERVTLTDRGPLESRDGSLAWFKRSPGPDDPSDLPPELLDRLEGYSWKSDEGGLSSKTYPTRAAALDALSAACVAYGRSVAKDCWHGVCEACERYGKPGHIPETRQTWAGWRKCPACDGTGKRRGLPPLTLTHSGGSV